MSEIQQVIDHAEELSKSGDFVGARTLLESAVDDHPDDPDLNAALGLACCHSQREFTAARLLPKTVSAKRHPELVSILGTYFHCRRLLAAKLGAEDDAAGQLAEMVAQFGSISEAPGIKVSACLIVKDEEANLARCLASLTEFVDEIVVVDTGSTDRTKGIAQEHGAVIGSFTWCDDFSAARNESLRLATGDWVLWIDADEVLDPSSLACLREAIMRPQFGGYAFRIVNFMDEANEADQVVHTAVRLFRRLPGISFEGRIHEQIAESIETLGLTLATLGEATLWHYGYQPAVMAAKRKVERTISMLEREVSDHPNEPFHWFNLANAYLAAGRFSDAERSSRTCLSVLPESAPYGPAAFQILASALRSQGRPDEALGVCEAASQRGLGTVLNEFERASAYFELGLDEEALDAANRCLLMVWPRDLIGDVGIKTYKAQALKDRIIARKRFAA